jgi:hypothetical protein
LEPTRLGDPNLPASVSCSIFTAQGEEALPTALAAVNPCPEAKDAWEI